MGKPKWLLFLFIGEVFTHWVSLMSGLASVLIAVWLDIEGKPALASYAFRSIAVLCVVCACFLAWRDKHVEASAAGEKLAKSADRVRVREQLAAYYSAGMDLMERLKAPTTPEKRTTETEVKDWRAEIDHFLGTRPPPLDGSHAARFKQPPKPKHVETGGLWLELQTYSEVLTAMIEELK